MEGKDSFVFYAKFTLVQIIAMCMYAFYADESGFSKSGKFESEQPILVVAGVLVDVTKLRKAVEVFDNILDLVNSKLSKPVKELKFSDIRNKNPYRIDIPKLEDRADLLHDIVIQFQKEITFKLLYSAIDNDAFFKTKATKPALLSQINHPYLCASFKILSQLNKKQSTLRNNKGKTFVIFDEQNQYQEKIEQLIEKPLHKTSFSAIFDTAYFGKSQYSKLIQIADLSAGLIRYYLLRRQQGSTDYWFTRMEGMIATLKPNIIHAECFSNSAPETELRNLYKQFEIHL
jgi:hypothetical protein